MLIYIIRVARVSTYNNMLIYIIAIHVSTSYGSIATLMPIYTLGH